MGIPSMKMMSNLILRKFSSNTFATMSYNNFKDRESRFCINSVFFYQLYFNYLTNLIFTFLFNFIQMLHRSLNQNKWHQRTKISMKINDIPPYRFSLVMYISGSLGNVVASLPPLWSSHYYFWSRKELAFTANVTN